MPINVNTVYTKQRLIRFNHYLARNRKVFWGLMTAFTLFAVLSMIFLAAIEADFGGLVIYLILILALDALSVFLYFGLPYFTFKKSKSLNTSIRYSFESDYLSIVATNQYSNENANVLYTIFSGVARNGNDLYLFLSGIKAYVVDLSALTPEQIEAIRELLVRNVNPKKIKWKK